MKKLLFIYALSFGILLQANAQREGRTERTPENIAQRAADRMAEKLELSDAQKKEIYDIQLKQIEARTAKMEALKKEMEASRTAHQEKINGVLSPEQKQKWEEIQEQNKERQRAWRERFKERREGKEWNRRKGPKPGAHRRGPDNNS